MFGSPDDCTTLLLTMCNTAMLHVYENAKAERRQSRPDCSNQILPTTHGMPMPNDWQISTCRNALAGLWVGNSKLEHRANGKHMPKRFLRRRLVRHEKPSCCRALLAELCMYVHQWRSLTACPHVVVHQNAWQSRSVFCCEVLAVHVLTFVIVPLAAHSRCARATPVV
jgi:hypothetical protein